MQNSVGTREHSWSSKIPHEQPMLQEVYFEVTSLTNRESQNITPTSATITERIFQTKCVICGQKSIKGVYNKFRFSEVARATKFLEAVAVSSNEELRLRLIDTDSADKLFCSDVMYHKHCFTTLMRETEVRTGPKCFLCNEILIGRISCTEISHESVEELKSIAEVNNDTELLEILQQHSLSETAQRVHNKCIERITHPTSVDYAFYETHVTPIVDGLLTGGYGLTLSEIRSTLLEVSEGIKIYRNEIKCYISSKYKERVSFCKPYRRNESLVVYPSYIRSCDMIQKLQTFDTVKQCALILRKNMMHGLDYKLNDSFCDREDLISSWKSTQIPETMAIFFSTLFNISKTKLLDTTPDLGDLQEHDDEEEVDGLSSSTKVLRSHSFCQAMYYSVNNGRKLAPLPIMAANSIYERCKSRMLITEQNRLGFSISYPRLLKMRSNLCAYTIESTKNNRVPLPSHMNKQDYIMCAFDNIDFKDSSSSSGTASTHDTVSVVFQTKNLPALKKCQLSEFQHEINYGRNNQKSLQCQKVSSFFIPRRKEAKLPDSIRFRQSQKYEKDSSDPLISLLQSCKKPESNSTLKIPPWKGVRSIVSKAQLGIKTIGFLPIVPAPVTSHSTVYTCILNFSSLCDEMDQPSLAVVCDEGVYQYVMDIYLAKPHLFKKLFFLLGGFPFAKA